ncbi:MAG: phosphoribosylformylglycinamidine cyclo-ligase [Kiritimatiellaeota bacterium]|nr:phosphoribosylformylglycinamidine cyclo-ligase [Kiritimatiellota bacterium]
MAKQQISTGDAYRDAGVDIDLAHTLLDQVKAKIAATRRPEVLAPIGGFGGLFQLDLGRYTHPVLVSSIDSVGTKVMVARMLDRHDTVGHDIVNHCINDIAVQGAEPLYFMDYLGTARLRSPQYEDLLSGLAEACAAQNVTLLGGETAELPGMYDLDYDLVGCITGVVERDRLITGERVRPGHAIVGFASNGLHTNGFSLARKVLFEDAGYTVNDAPDALGESVGDALLHPHTCYWPVIRTALETDLPLDGLAHITGGGWFDNIPRVLPPGAVAVCRRGVLPVPPIFGLIRQAGGIGEAEMFRVFNMGVGMVWFVPPEAVDTALSLAAAAGFRAAFMGEVRKGDGPARVSIPGLTE